MKNFYLNLNQLPSKNYGEPTVNRQSRLMSQSGCGAVDVPMTSYGAPDEHPMSIRSASDERRWKNRGWKYVACMLMVFVLSVGQMWSADQILKTVDFSTSAWSSATFTANATTVVDGVTASSGSSSSKPTISISSGKFTMSSNMSSGKNCVGFQVSGIQYGTLIIEVYSDASTVTKCNYTVKDGGSSFSTSDAGGGTSSTAGEPIIVTGLTKTSAYVYVGRQGSDYTKFSKIIVKTPNPTGKTYAESTFYTTYASSSKTNAQLISSASFPENFLPIFAGASALNDKPTSTPTVTTPYDFSGVSTSSNSYILQTANNNVLLLNNVANVKSVRFYGDGNGSSGNISVNVTKQSGSGSTFSVSNISFTSTKTILEHSTGDLTGKSGYDANTFYNYKFTFSKKFHIWGVYVEAIVAEKDYTVTAVSSNDTYGTVSAEASSLNATETTTITASPATGYQVTNWAVSGTGASISPSGASNSNTTTLTMGTANATVTATFGLKSYTVTLNNQSATSAGTENVTTTYNSNTNLTSAITKPTKTGYVFAGYFTAANGGGVQLIDYAGNWIASAGGGSTYMDGSKNWKYDNSLTLYACWMEYCPGMDMAAQAISLGSGEHQTWTGLTTNMILYSVAGNTTFDDSSDASNAYDGLKFKNNGDYILFLVQANSSLKLYFGYTDTKPKISINGGAESNVNVTSTQTKTPNQEVDFGTQTYDRLIKLRTVTSNTVVLQKIEITAPSGCSAYEFHYGTNGQDNWETECFEQVGETNEWKIEDFTIPSTTHFYVGYHGDGTNGWNSTWSSERAWTDWPTKSDNKWQGQIFLAPNDGALGSFAVGQATGAVGTLTIHSGYNDLNKYLSFTPNGYGITYGGTGHTFVETATSNMYETDVVTLPDVSTTYNIGLATATEGTYVKSIHSKATDEAISAMGVTEFDGGKKKIYLSAGVWKADASGEKMAIWDATDGHGYWGANDNRFMTYNSTSGLFEGYVNSDATKIVLVRLGEGSGTPNWDNKWNQTDDITLSALNNKFSITGWHIDNDDDKNSSYTVTSTHPTTGQKGKFRMWANSASTNWYVHWIPYYVLSYDANGGSGTTAATERNSESSTLTVSVAANGFTAPAGYEFAGWATSDERADARTVDYAAGGSYTLTSNATLYAVWRPILVTAISVSPDSKTLDVGGTVTLSATATPATALDKTVTWSSSNTSVATVTDAGFVTAVAPGSATITATANDGSLVTGTCSITVNKITPETYTFSADNTSICSGSDVTFTIAGSQVGATYYVTKNSKGGDAIGDSKAGTGLSLSFTVPSATADDYYCYTSETTNYKAGKVSSGKVIISHKTATSISSQPNGIADATVGVEQTLSVTAAGTNLEYQWKVSDTENGTYSNVASDGTSASYSVTPAAAGTKWYQVVVTGDCGEVTSNKVSIVAAAAATCTGDPTALISGELYTIDEMVSNCSATAISSTTSGGTGIFQYGLSSNGKFYVVGTTNGNNETTGTVEMKKQGDSPITVKDETFTYIAWFKGAGSTSCRSIKFVTPSAGTLIIYGKVTDKKGNIELKQGSNSAVDVMANSKNGSDTVHVSITAGATCYIWADGGSAALYGLKFVAAVPCTTPPTVTVGSNSSVTSTTATVSCASGISSLGTGGCTITEYGFVIGESANPEIGGSGVTKHVVGTTYTTTGTSFSKDLTGLTASTTYYVRPYATNGYGTAYGTQTSFTTLVAGATPIVSWDLKVNANWVDVDGTSDNASITDPETSTSNITVTTANLANKTDKLELSSNGSRYVEFTFDVACGKKLTPDSIVMQVLNVGGKSGGKMTHKAELSDSYGHKISGTVQPSTDGSLTKLKVTNGDKVYFQGAVSLKVWAWNHDGTNGTAFRMGQDVDIYGAVGDQTTPTATITWTKQPAGGLSGTNETVTAVSSDGSAVTITSNNGSVATVAGSTVSYVGVGSTYLTASGTDACGNTMVSVNSDNFTVIGAYNLNYDANTGTGTMTGETGVHYAVVAENDFTAPSGKVFFGWNTAANGTGDSYQPGDAIELNANTTLYAQWGTALTATWSVTKVDSKLYRGGGGYSVTVYLNQADWDASGNKDDLDLTATEGVTLKNIVKSINGDGKAQVTADFDITTGVDADATSITFTLFVPAAGTYASAELTDDEGLEDCGERSVTVTWTPTSDDITTLTSKDNGVLTIGTGSNVFKIYAIRGNSGSGSDAAMAYSAGNGLEFNDNNYYKSGIETYVPTSSNDISDISFYVKTSNSGRNTIYGTHDTSIQSSNPLTTLTLTTDFAAYSTKSSTLWNSCSKNKYYGVGGRSGGSGTVYLQKVTVTFSSGGGVTPTLSWETDLDGGVSTETGASDFTHTVTQDRNSLGAITYASSNTSVVTVNATSGKVHVVGVGDATITATIAASGCFEEATATYNIHVEDNCIDEPGTISATDLGCDGIQMTVSGHTALAGVSYQWYKVGTPDEAISGATSATYTATAAGEYYVVVTNTGTDHCPMASTNTIKVTAKAAATAEKIVDRWYVKNGRRTPDIELVQTTGATGFIVKIGETKIWDSDGSETTGFGGCGFRLGEDGIIYLNGTTAEDGSGDAPSGLTGATDVILKITAEGCGGNASELSITIHCQASTTRKSIAFVVDGTEKGTFAQANADHSTNSALFKFLDYGDDSNGAFDLTAQNIYSTTDEKAIREHFSQFDAIIITDDPNTKKNPANKSGDYYKNHGYVNAFGTMIDVRPILSMEAFVSRLTNWGAKGVAGDPSSPNPRQYEMRLECKDHEIYSGLPAPAAGTHVWAEFIDGDEYRHVIMVDSTKSPYNGVAYNADTDDKPALQGFESEDMGNLLGLGLISEGALHAGIERQEEPAARMMILGVQAKALPNALTEEGKKVIENALTYLLKTNMEEVDDCSNYFKGGTAGKEMDWNTASNWAKNTLPTFETRVRILAPCEISNAQVRVAQVDIATSGTSSKIPGGTCSGSLTIMPTGALVVEGKVRTAEAPRFTVNDLKPTTVNDLIINTDEYNQAALIFNNDDADTKATVNLYSLGRKPSSYQYQYFAVPMEVVPVNPTFANETHGTGIYTYVYNEATSGWERRRYYDDLFAFEGLGITTKSTDPMNYTMTGNLASTATKEITLTHDGAGLNLIGNSWMAPIQIGALAEDNAGLDNQTVYIYCAGRDAVKGEATSGVTETAGQWIAIPFEAAEFDTWKAAGKLSVIPAMQAFQIKVDAEATLTLDYDKVVRGSTNDLNAKLRAPGRRMAANEVTMTNIRVADSKTHTDLSLFEGDRFSEAFDNGWEAEYMNGDGRSAKLYAETEAGQMAVAAMYDYEGTVVGFAPGQETEYTFSFMGEDNGYYLNDIKLQNSVRISEGETYTFTYEEGDAANRFYISRTAINAPEVTTGMENLDAATPRVQKIIYNDKLYIIRGGRLYDATGKVVK